MRTPAWSHLAAPATTIALLALLAGPASATTSATPGSVHQVVGKDGCYTADGASPASHGTCHNIRGGTGSTTIAISPDGHFAYLVGYGQNNALPHTVPVLSIFRRDQKTGVLHQLAGKAGCFSRDGSSEDGPGTCTKARNLDTGDAQSLVLSADGRFLYAASQYEPSPGVFIGGIAIFSRNLKNGTLRQLPGKEGCLSADGSSSAGPGTCAVAREVDSVSNLHVTPDQRYLYASVYDGQPHSGIAIFLRDRTNGTLRQLAGKEGCITDNGSTDESGASVICRAMPNIGSPWDIATPGNHFAYVPDSNDDLVQAFRRDAKGGLKPLTGKGACVSDTGSSPLGPGTCVHGRGLFDVERAILSRNTAFIYTNSFGFPSPITVLNRNLTTGLLSQRPGTAACISADGTSGDSSAMCRKGRALGGGYAGALAPNGALYFAEWGSTDLGLVIFHVSVRTGAFSQLSGKLGCVTPNGASTAGGGMCEKARAVEGAYQVAIASGGRDVYVASQLENGVALFHAAG